MKIEVLVVPGCSPQRLAEERLRQALGCAGLSGESFTTRVIGDQAEAERSGFTGSPTILFDDRDPFAVPGPLARLLAVGGVPGLPHSAWPGRSFRGRPASAALRAAADDTDSGT
ncbi:hypothetical protein [Streptomyces sp. 8K308]|uniref:hypothetical protein n=1 Tax=Streptomyces sp. 8K308 TaxID=2530388 RepID=UPI001A9D968A|nr:hypothetical protein [Streptomyces sp. 8K308]